MEAKYRVPTNKEEIYKTFNTVTVKILPLLLGYSDPNCREILAMIRCTINLLYIQLTMKMLDNEFLYKYLAQVKLWWTNRSYVMKYTGTPYYLTILMSSSHL